MYSPPLFSKRKSQEQRLGSLIVPRRPHPQLSGSGDVVLCLYGVYCAGSLMFASAQHDLCHSVLLLGLLRPNMDMDGTGGSNRSRPVSQQPTSSGYEVYGPRGPQRGGHARWIESLDAPSQGWGVRRRMVSRLLPS